MLSYTVASKGNLKWGGGATLIKNLDKQKKVLTLQKSGGGGA